jgi:hypothetical protein
LFDRFRGGGSRDEGRGGRERGGRTGRDSQRGERAGGRQRARVDDRTEALPVQPSQRAKPPAESPAPPRRAPPATGGHAPTEVHQVPQAPPRSMPPPQDRPPPPPQQAPAAGPSDAEKTRIFGAPALKSSVVGVLVATAGELQGQAYVVPDKGGKDVVLGRGTASDVCIPSEWISRSHAKIIVHEGRFMIGALSEENPTLVNDTATQGTELNDGDTVQLGKTTLRFRTI